MNNYNAFQKFAKNFQSYPSWTITSFIQLLATGVSFFDIFLFLGFLNQFTDLIWSQTSSLDVLGFLLMHAQDVLLGCQTLATKSTVRQSWIARRIHSYPWILVFPFLSTNINQIVRENIVIFLLLAK